MPTIRQDLEKIADVAERLAHGQVKEVMAFMSSTGGFEKLMPVMDALDDERTAEIIGYKLVHTDETMDYVGIEPLVDGEGYLTDRAARRVKLGGWLVRPDYTIPK